MRDYIDEIAAQTANDIEYRCADLMAVKAQVAGAIIKGLDRQRPEAERLRGLLLLSRGALLKATGGDEYGEYDHILKQIDAALVHQQKRNANGS